MKLIHLSDLHLGKRIHSYNMENDQWHILKEIIKIIDKESPNAVIIAGDVYDKPVPSEKAVKLFDEFLTTLANLRLDLHVFIISGNHDSPQRLSFANQLINSRGIHISPEYNGNVDPISVTDEYGTVNVYMLPFIKPINVREKFKEEKIDTYTDALRTAISKMNIDAHNRNILVTHQFVTGASTSESEERTIGGTDNVDVSVFEAFDYVALGHLHRQQKCSYERVRYCGTPLKYSLSEIKDRKSVTVVELKEKGNLDIRTIELSPLHEMLEIKGKFNMIRNKEECRKKYPNLKDNDYLHIILTDEYEQPNAMSELSTIYPNFLKLDYDNQQTKSDINILGTYDVKNMNPIELFASFYEQQNNQPMSDKQKDFMENLIKEIWEEKNETY